MTSEDRSLPVLVASDDVGGWRLLAPAVGWWCDPPESGTIVGPGTNLGRLRLLNRVSRLVVPDGVAGRFEMPPAHRVVAVGFEADLGRVVPLSAGDQQTLASRHLEAGHPADTGLPEGCWAVTAPTDGVFYRRSRPDTPAFVELGSRVRAGQAVGLVEVMKTFNPIRYGGPGLPQEVEVIEIRGADGQEIRAGQVLVVVR